MKIFGAILIAFVVPQVYAESISTSKFKQTRSSIPWKSISSKFPRSHHEELHCRLQKMSLMLAITTALDFWTLLVLRTGSVARRTNLTVVMSCSIQFRHNLLEARAIMNVNPLALPTARDQQ